MSISRALGRRMAGVLSRPRRRYRQLEAPDLELLRRSLQPGDVLLVEGNTRISTAIQYITQSTWSHSAFFAGPVWQEPGEAEPRVLIEADLENGVTAVPLSKYAEHNMRICRPVGLDDASTERVVSFMVGSIGLEYDLKNIFDLARYFLPLPPLPRRWRRRLIELGSGEPTKAICSTLLAQAFQQIGYPILPRYEQGSEGLDEETVLRRRHHSYFTPCDFDLSPYFRIVKPTLEAGYDYRQLKWAQEPQQVREGNAKEPRRSPGADPEGEPGN
jgi:hypothetical protein